ncbi:hypothetical protein CCUS01_03217 [Colletotrichum cuscutae]|uniref:Uncharacterized protein n=1 Tax=Colletotrichum cuscutae TaxID=1209917 RepID=A0AAI9Y9W3_9PEZI|nr:hypothetical protein CCUS01_03217 [Colletotrichum cuscutae]
MEPVPLQGAYKGQRRPRTTAGGFDYSRAWLQVSSALCLFNYGSGQAIFLQVHVGATFRYNTTQSYACEQLRYCSYDISKVGSSIGYKTQYSLILTLYNQPGTLGIHPRPSDPVPQRTSSRRNSKRREYSHKLLIRSMSDEDRDPVLAAIPIAYLTSYVLSSDFRPKLKYGYFRVADYNFAGTVEVLQMLLNFHPPPYFGVRLQNN